jgi:branched-chain amino acid transport system substrate-binding protein
MKHKVLLGLFVFTVAVVFLFGAGCGSKPPAKDKIVIGQAVALSGWDAIIHNSGPAQTQQLWVDEVNAKGGIYVKEYGKKLPIELIVYDDKSEHGQTHGKIDYRGQG